MNFGVWCLEMWMCPAVTGLDVEYANSPTRELVICMRSKIQVVCDAALYQRTIVTNFQS
jgi:hypothetical protein